MPPLHLRFRRQPHRGYEYLPQQSGKKDASYSLGASVCENLGEAIRRGLG